MINDDRRARRPAGQRAERACPICGRESRPEAFPFCSKRCADVDLNRWLVGAYSLPAAETEGDEEPGSEES